MPIRRRGFGAGIAGAASNINDFLTKKWSQDEVTKRQQQLQQAQELAGLNKYKMDNPDPEIIKHLVTNPKDAEVISPELMQQSMGNFAQSRGMAQNDPTKWGLESKPNNDALMSRTIRQQTPMGQLMRQSQNTLNAQKAQVGAFNTRENTEHPVDVKTIGPDNQEISTPAVRGSAAAYAPSVGRTQTQEGQLNEAQAAGTQRGNAPTAQTIAAKVNEFNALTPGAVARSAGEAGAGESARIKAGAAEKQRTEGAAQAAKTKEQLIADVDKQAAAADEELKHALAQATAQQTTNPDKGDVIGPLVTAAMQKHSDTLRQLQQQKQQIIMGQQVTPVKPAGQVNMPTLPKGVTVKRVG